AGHVEWARRARGETIESRLALRSRLRTNRIGRESGPFPLHFLEFAFHSINALYLKPDMIQGRSLDSSAGKICYVPRHDNKHYPSIRKIKIRIVGRLLHFREFEHISVEFCQPRRFNSPQRYMLDLAFLLAICFDVGIRPVFHVLLGKIKDVARRVMRADTSEWSGTWPFQYLNKGIVFFQSVINNVHVFDFESKMIETRLAACLAFSGIDIQADVTVPYHHGSERSGILRWFHTKHALIKSAEKSILVTHNRQVL